MRRKVRKISYSLYSFRTACPVTNPLLAGLGFRNFSAIFQRSGFSPKSIPKVTASRTVPYSLIQLQAQNQGVFGNTKQHLSVFGACRFRRKNSRNPSRRKGCKGFRLGGDYWTRTSDLLRVKRFRTRQTPQNIRFSGDGAFFRYCLMYISPRRIVVLWSYFCRTLRARHKAQGQDKIPSAV